MKHRLVNCARNRDQSPRSSASACQTRNGSTAARLPGAALVFIISTALCTQANAQWNSIRSSNRSAPPQRSAPRAQGGERGHEQEHRQAPVATGHEREGERSREPEHGAAVGRDHDHVEYFHPEVREPKHFDYDEDRHRPYYWFGINPGIVIGSLPLGHIQIYVGGNPYDYYQGAFYQQGSSGYVSVTPPIGAIVPALPAGAETIPVGATVYCYAGGAFYVQAAQGFQVVVPPPGITVGSLPAGAAAVNVNGAIYYQGDGTYFVPSIQNGVTVYTTAQP